MCFQRYFDLFELFIYKYRKFDDLILQFYAFMCYIFYSFYHIHFTFWYSWKHLNSSNHFPKLPRRLTHVYLMIFQPRVDSALQEQLGTVQEELEETTQKLDKSEKKITRMEEALDIKDDEILTLREYKLQFIIWWFFI